MTLFETLHHRCFEVISTMKYTAADLFYGNAGANIR